MNVDLKKLYSLPVIISALGYFVDVYDLTLFSIVRIESLKDLGLSGDALMHEGIFILNMQMFGMLLGGILWGILGDKKGRTSVLLASILLYSLATLVNGFMEEVNTYAWIRFFAGVGLAGELGVAITLVAESLPQQYRSYGTTLVAVIGISGAVAGYYVAQSVHWRAAYWLGGAMGLVLLFLRFRLLDSPLFKKMLLTDQPRGHFLMLFQSPQRFFCYLRCVLLGLPSWAMTGLVVTFSPEIAQSMHISTPIHAGKALMLCYFGAMFGDATSGFLSQYLQSRKQTIACFLLFNILAIAVLLSFKGYSADWFYWGIFAVGFGTGFWALFLIMVSEQFGTNLRATATTSAPSFVRGCMVPMALGFKALQTYVAVEYAALIITISALMIALMALYGLKETFHRQLEFYEK